MGQAESTTKVARRNGAPDEIWERATSEMAIAAQARLEALASVSSTDPERDAQPEEASADGDDVLAYRMRLRRLCYSSVLTAHTPEGAKVVLTRIFMQALLNNPKKQIGGILFYDEQTGAIVQVIEGPAHHVRTLFHGRILRDPRHTSVRKLWDIDVQTRRHETFGMKCGDIDLASEAPGLGETQLHAAEPSLVRLTYSSRLLAHQSITAYRMIMEILRSSIRHNAQVSVSTTAHREWGSGAHKACEREGSPASARAHAVVTAPRVLRARAHAVVTAPRACLALAHAGGHRRRSLFESTHLPGRPGSGGSPSRRAHAV